MLRFKDFIFSEEAKKEKGYYIWPDERGVQKLTKGIQYYEGPYKKHGKTQVPDDISIFQKYTRPSLYGSK